MYFIDLRILLIFIINMLFAWMPLLGQNTTTDNKIPNPTYERIALVIGNAAYQNVPPLVNTINDVNDMRDTLKQLGFEVIYQENATQDDMLNGLAKLSEKAAGKEVLFYYSGHGTQIAGRNYLLPVDVRATTESTLKISSIEMESVLEAMSDGRKKIVILDACRDNPYAKAIGRNLGRGLVQVTESPDETLIIYSTGPGDIASDNPAGRNGLFTQYLLVYMQKEGLEILDCMREVTREVKKASNNQQKPWWHASLESRFYFKPEVAWKPSLVIKPQDSIAEKQKQLAAIQQAQREAEARLQAAIRRQAELVELRRREELRQKEESNQQNITTDSSTSPLSIARPSGFTFLRNATYTCNDITHTVAEYRHDQTGMEFVLIPGGKFLMGSNDGAMDERPVHEVTLSPYLISKTEVTQEVWLKVMEYNPSKFQKGNQHPVEQVSWDDCQNFCQRTGLQLPTESQWECAARAGNTGPWVHGDQANGLGQYAWYDERRADGHHPVAQKSPNAYGLYDMTGNVAEWCHDWFTSYSSKAETDPEGSKTGSCRVSRGGCWVTTIGGVRTSFRMRSSQNYSSSDLGFRVAARP